MAVIPDDDGREESNVSLSISNVSIGIKTDYDYGDVFALTQPLTFRIKNNSSKITYLYGFELYIRSHKAVGVVITTSGGYNGKVINPNSYVQVVMTSSSVTIDNLSVGFEYNQNAIPIYENAGMTLKADVGMIVSGSNITRSTASVTFPLPDNEKINVYDKVIQTLSIYSSLAKTSYYDGENFSSSGLSLQATYLKPVSQTTVTERGILSYTLSFTTDNSGAFLNYTFTKADADAGLKPLYALYKGKYVSMILSVGYEESSYRFSLAYEGTYDNSYYVGETFNMSGLSFYIKVYYSGLLQGNVDIEQNEVDSNISGAFIGSDTSINHITFTTNINSVIWGGTSHSIGQLSVNVPVTVQPDNITSITKSGTLETSYYDGDALDITDIEITANFVSGATETKTLAEFIEDGILELYNSDNDIVFSISNILTTDYDNTNFYARVVGTDTKIWLGQVQVDEVVLSSITATITKQDYKVGEYFINSGLSVKGIYNNGSEIDINLNDVTITFNEKNINGQYVFVDDDVNATGLTITYGELEPITLTFSVNYGELESLSLKLKDGVSSSFKSGNSFVPSNIFEVNKVYRINENETYTDNTDYIENVTFTYEKDIISGENTIICDDASDYGLCWVKATLTNDSSIYGTFTISILRNEIIESIICKPRYSDYQVRYVGEKFDTNDVQVLVQYSGVVGAVETTDYTSIPRINDTLISASYNKKVKIYVGTLETSYEIKILIPYKDYTNDTNTYKIARNVENIEHDGDYITFGKNDGTPPTTKYPLFLSNKVINGSYNGSTPSADCIGYIDFGYQDKTTREVIKNAKVVLFENYPNSVGGDGNITVKFPNYNEQSADKINKCRFGKVFNKHLFLSGNINYPNYDWHSSSINKSQNSDNEEYHSFTYFSDLDYCYYGSNATAIVGYDVYKDGSLIVVKQSSKTEATLYKRDVTYTQAMDYAGNVITGQVEESYPSFDINANGGEGGYNYKNIANFNGDTLIVTKTGIKALASKNTTYNNERILIDASTYINNKILNENIKNSLLYTFKDNLYLKTDRGLYVGYYDLRNNEDGDYEWYFLDIPNVDNIFDYEDEIYFSNTDGEIYKFKNDVDYVDSFRTYIAVGGTTINYGTDRIVFAEEYKDYFQNGLEIAFENKKQETNSATYYQSHANLGYFNSSNNEVGEYVGRFIAVDNASSTNNDWYIELNDNLDENFKTLFYDGKSVWFDDITRNDNPNIYIETHKEYKLRYYGDNKYLIEDARFDGINRLRLSYELGEDKRTYISDVDSEDSDFKLVDGMGNDIDIIAYNGEVPPAIRTRAIITREVPIEAYYITKPFDFGSQLYKKTIWMWTIANDTALDSKMSAKVFHNIEQENYRVYTGENDSNHQISMNRINFFEINFNSSNLPHIYINKRVLPNIDFFRLLLYNDTKSNMVMGNVSIQYTISGITKGVKQ